MKINVAKAKQQIGGVFPFDYTVTSEKLGLDSDTTWRKSQIVVSGEFVNNGQKIEVRGLIQSSGIFTCSRCLEDISIDLKIPFLESFFEEGVKVDDEDIVVYTDDEIEIDDLIREYLILAEPINPVCNTDCHGLCAICGTNLNTATCTCDTKPPDPRLAVLSELLTPKQNKE